MTWLCHLQLLDIAGHRRRVQALVCQVHSSTYPTMRNTVESREDGAKSVMARSLLGRTLRIARGSAGCRRAFSSRDGIAGFLDELVTRRVVHDTTHPLASMANQLQ
jgi:hypothetical protein